MEMINDVQLEGQGEGRTREQSEPGVRRQGPASALGLLPCITHFWRVVPCEFLV